MRYLVFALCLFCFGCAAFNDQFDGGYRYCKKDDVYWHKQWGETHKCEWGSIVKNADGTIRGGTK